MIITMEKSVAGKTEVKKIFSEDLGIYLRNGWKEKKSTVTEEHKVEVKPVVENTPVETVKEEPEYKVETPPVEESKTEERPYDFYSKKKKKNH